jgi:Fur family ferric uptake transcriptional regulator
VTDPIDTPTEMTDLQQRLRASGLRATSGRLRLLHTVTKSERPLSHSELTSTLPDMDRVTLYRGIRALVDAGLCRQLLAGGVVRIEAVRTPEDAGHPHFVCVDCDTVICLPQQLMTSATTLQVPWQRAVNAASLQLQGQCPDCTDPTKAQTTS